MQKSKANRRRGNEALKAFKSASGVGASSSSFQKQQQRYKIVQKLGLGSYGIVYDAIDTVSDTHVAIKRNIIDSKENIAGIQSLREGDILSRISGHPFVVRYIGHFGNSDRVFDGIRIKGGDFDGYHRDDYVHYVMGMEDTSLFHIISELSFYDKMQISVQLLMGIDWCHANGINHRDISISNVLYNKSTKRATICDFGLAHHSSGSFPSKTPGIYTSWYRPPEVCGVKFDNDDPGLKYNHRSDIWAAGAVIFELFSGEALLDSAGDSNAEIVARMVRNIPSMFSIDEVSASDKKLFKKASTDAGVNVPSDYDHRLGEIEDQILTRLKFDDDDEARYAKEMPEGASVEKLVNLISKLLYPNPDERITLCDAISHPFFDSMREYILSVEIPIREECFKRHEISIVPCPAREMAMNIIFTIYNNRKSLQWYSHRIMFHAIDIYDAYLTHMSKKEGEKVNLDTVPIQIYSCIYIFLKFFQPFNEAPIDWKRVAPKEIMLRFRMSDFISFESLVVKEICNMQIYRDTLYEYMHQQISRESENYVRRMLFGIGHWKEEIKNASVEEIFNQIPTDEDLAQP